MLEFTRTFRFRKVGSCRKTCDRACWLNLAAQPAQDESDVSLRICSRDKQFTSFRGILGVRGGLGRRGQESNLPRFLRTDDGFEDREGHQAPFTLRKEEKENAERSTPNAQRLIKEEELLRFLNRSDDLVEVGPITGIEFGMEQFAIGANFKGAAARRNERERFDAFAEFKNFGRQTDGLGRVVSNHAVFD